MPKSFLKISVGVVVLILALLYALDYLESAVRKRNPSGTTNTPPVVLYTNTAGGRVAISNALARVQRELNAATNADEIAALRLMEQTLTNALVK